MKIYLSLIFASILFFKSAYAGKSITCRFDDKHKVKASNGRVRTLKSKHLMLKGNLDFKKGGKISVISDFLFGSLNPQNFRVHRNYRKNERKQRFAKFSTKTQSSYKKGDWLPTYVKISLPKRLSKKDKYYVAYLGYFKAKENIQGLPAGKNRKPNAREKASFNRENETSIEYKLLCKK